MIVNSAINTELKNVRLFVWHILFFESSQIQFYLRHIPLSCITIIKIKEKYFEICSIGPRV